MHHGTVDFAANLRIAIAAGSAIAAAVDELILVLDNPAVLAARPWALRRLKKISGACRSGSLTFCNNFAVLSFSAKT